LSLSLIINANGQTKSDDIWQQVLEKGVVDSMFVFGKWTKEGQTETRLRYLGQVTTTDGRVFKILNSCWIWGLSYRASNRILFFNAKNQYIGNYCVNTPSELPEKLYDGKLIFTNKENKECDKKIITKVSFIKGIPKRIFLECKDKYGDVYSFSSD
jgi:hypothetical protein